MLVTAADGKFNAYVARPAATPAPAVVVLQEIFGVNADIRATCDELAERGFIAIAPDLFWRESPGLDLNSWSTSEWQRALEIYRAFDLDRGVGDVTATVHAARELAGSSGKVGVMGYCLGGLMTFLTAARMPVDAGVEYYGGNTDQHLGEAGAVRAPLLIHLGEEDEFISKDAQQQIRAAFAGMPNVRIFNYPGCAHAFARHTGAHFNADAARLANDRTFRFLDQHLR
jgi:carboxymethylenebutenolidase